MTLFQRRMMKELLTHLDGLNIYIKNLDDEIDNFMKPEEKQASQAIQDVTGIGNTSAQAVLLTVTFLRGRDYVPVIMKAPKSGNPARPGKGMYFCKPH